MIKGLVYVCLCLLCLFLLELVTMRLAWRLETVPLTPIQLWEMQKNPSCEHDEPGCE